MINTQRTLFDLVLEGVEKNCHFICSTKTPTGWKYIHKKEFLEQIRHIALGLHDLGIRKGDKVALHSENSNMWLILDLAIVSIGAVTVPIYVTQSQEQIEFILDHSEAKVLFVSHDSLIEHYNSFITKFQDVHKYVIDHSNNIAFDNIEYLFRKGKELNDAQPDLFKQLYSAVQPSDLATIGYTSGTTGMPKGVMLSHANLAHAIQAPAKRCFFYDKVSYEKDAALSFLPFTHVFEHCVIYAYLHIGLAVYIVPDVEFIKEALQEKSPIHFSSVPRLLEKVYKGIHEKVEAQTGIAGYLARYALARIPEYQLNKSPSFSYRLIDMIVFKKIRKQLGGKLMGITSGGAALSSKVMHFFNAIGIPVGQAYGLTETSPGLTTYLKDNLRLDTAGVALDGVILKIAEDGEILAQGPNIMQGYYKAPEKTAEVLQDGWFHTGDIGHIDENGFLFITDRKKELLKLSTGKYVAPAPIENKLVTYSGIEQAVVLGDGQKFCAVLIVPSGPEEDHNILQEKVQYALDDINQGLSPWETVKKFVISNAPMTIESDELTPTMKKKRRIIYQKRANEISSLYND